MSKLNNLSLINSIKTYINNNKIYAKHFDFIYKTQHYSLDEVLPEIIKIIKYANPWRSSYILLLFMYVFIEFINDRLFNLDIYYLIITYKLILFNIRTFIFTHVENVYYIFKNKM